MERQSLKELFFIGKDEEVNAFLENIKPRCIKVPTDSRYMTINTQYGVEKVVYNSDHDSFIDQHMNEYKIDKFSETLEPIDTFVEVTIYRGQRKRPQGARYSITKETISQASLDIELWLVQDCMNEDYYLYRDNSRTKKLHVARNMWKWCDIKELSERSDVTVATTFVDDDGVLQDYPIEDKTFTTLEYMTNYVTYIDVEGQYKKVRVFESELDDAAFASCKCCGEFWRKEDLDVHGRCDFCNQINIYPYHTYDGSLNFLNSPEDDIEEKMYFGTEVETVGDTSNKVAITDYQHMWHLEEDGSIYPEGFEMISQPMTWKYILEHKGEIQSMFEKLQELGQEAEETDCCGLHIHVSRDAFESSRAVERAIAIVHRLNTEFMAFSRRENYEYCEFHHLKGNFTWNDVHSVPQQSHGCAVNTGNIGDERKNTVEFRFFKSTLDINTYLAAIELVKRIVEVANSNTMMVTMCTLLDGSKYAKKYVDAQMAQGVRYHLRSYSCDFKHAYLKEFMDDYSNSNNPYQAIKDFTEFLARNRGVEVKTTTEGFLIRNPLAVTEERPEIAGTSESEVA